jgi:hypothetical protein
MLALQKANQGDQIGEILGLLGDCLLGRFFFKFPNEVSRIWGLLFFRVK